MAAEEIWHESWAYYGKPVAGTASQQMVKEQTTLVTRACLSLFLSKRQRYVASCSGTSVSELQDSDRHSDASRQCLALHRASQPVRTCSLPLAARMSCFARKPGPL